MIHPEKQRWSRWYVTVILALLAQILFYYWFTSYWS